MSLTTSYPKLLEAIRKRDTGAGTPSAIAKRMDDTPRKTLTPLQLRQLIIDRLESDTTLGLVGKLDPNDIDHLAGGLATVLAGTTIKEM